MFQALSVGQLPIEAVVDFISQLKFFQAFKMISGPMPAGSPIETAIGPTVPGREFGLIMRDCHTR